MKGKNNLLSKEEIDLFQVKRSIISLYKSFLVMLEDLEEEHIRNFNNLYESFDEDHAKIIRQADYLNNERVLYLRKKILDAGNDCIRKVEGKRYD